MNQPAPDLAAATTIDITADRANGVRPGPVGSISTGRVSTHLALLSLGIALPLLSLTILLVNELIDTQRHGMRVTLASNSKLLATLTDSELETSMTLAATLARSEALKVGDLDQFRRQASQRLQFLPQTWVNVTGPDGRIVTSTLEKSNTGILPDSDAATRARAILSGRPEVSDLIEAASSDSAPVAFVSMAVPEPVGAPRNVVSIAVQPARLAGIIADKFEPDVLVAILDRNRRFVARTQDHSMRVGTLASPSWRTALTRAEQGIIEAYSIEGDARVLSYRPTVYGWTVGVGYKKETIEAPYTFIRRVMWIVGTLFLLAGGVATILLSRRITRPARQLLEASSCLADMRPVKAAPTGVAEFDAVIDHFSQVADMLNEREQALRSSEQRFRTAIEASESGTWTWDTRTDLRTIDARNRAIMGWNCD